MGFDKGKAFGFAIFTIATSLRAGWVSLPRNLAFQQEMTSASQLYYNETQFNLAAQKRRQNMENKLTTGICKGLCIGIAISAAVHVPIWIGICAGIPAGFVIGQCRK